MDSTLIDATALTAIDSFLLSLLKPFVELLPFAHPDAPTHDSTLRLLNVVINLLVVAGVAASQGRLTAANALPLVLQALAQSAGGQVFYTTVTRSGSSVGSVGSVGSGTGAASQKSSAATESAA